MSKTRRVRDKPNNHAARLIDFVNKRHRVEVHEVASRFGFSQFEAYEYLNVLAVEGFIIRDGTLTFREVTQGDL